jgi:hypothetical protein
VRQVFLLGGAASLLARGRAFGPGGTVASVTLPELQRLRSPYDEEYGTGKPRLHSCDLHATESGMFVVECPRPLPAEQAATWTATVMATMAPSSVVVATTILVGLHDFFIMFFRIYANFPNLFHRRGGAFPQFLVVAVDCSGLHHTIAVCLLHPVFSLSCSLPSSEGHWTTMADLKV